MEKNHKGTGRGIIDQDKDQGHFTFSDVIIKLLDNKPIKYIIIAILLVVFIGIVYLFIQMIKSRNSGTAIFLGPVTIPEDPFLEININNTCQTRIPTYLTQFASTMIPPLTQTLLHTLTPTIDNYSTATPLPSSTITHSNTSTPYATITSTVFPQGTSVSLPTYYEIINPCADNNQWIFDQDYLDLKAENVDCLDKLKKYGFYPKERGIHINLTTLEGNNIYSISRPILNKNWKIGFELKPYIFYGSNRNDIENKGHENSAIFYVGLYNSNSKELKYRLINIKNALEDNEYNIWIASSENYNTLAKNEKIYVECERKDASVTCSLKDNENKLISKESINLDLIYKPFDHFAIGFDLNENTTIDIVLESLMIEYH